MATPQSVAAVLSVSRLTRNQVRRHALSWFLSSLFFLGIGGASFCVFTVWLPELYATECRASAFAFATSFGRFIAAAATFRAGAAVAHSGTLGRPVSMTRLIFVLGLFLLPLAAKRAEYRSSIE